MRNAGGELKLLNLTQKVHDLLQITKLCTVFDIQDDEAVGHRRLPALTDSLTASANRALFPLRTTAERLTRLQRIFLAQSLDTPPAETHNSCHATHTNHYLRTGRPCRPRNL